MKKTLLSFLVAVIALIIFNIDARAEWIIDPISATYDEDLLPARSYAIGADGTYHVVFIRQLPGGFIGFGPREAYYTYKEPGDVWSTPEKVSLEDTDIGDPSIVISAEGQIYIIFQEVTEDGMENFEKIIVAEKTQDEWIYHEIPTIEEKNSQPSASIDQNGNIHIVWNQVDDNWETLIAYAQNMTGEWQVQAIADTDNWDWEGPKIAVSEQGVAHILFFDASDNVKYLTNTTPGGFSWTSATLETGVSYNEFGRIMCHQGVVHVVASGYDNWGDPSHFYYFKKEDDNWTQAVQITDEFHGNPVALTVDNTGNVRVAGLIYDLGFEVGSLFIIDINQDIITENAFAETTERPLLAASIGFDIYDNLFVIFNEEIEDRNSNIYMAHQGIPSYTASFEVKNEEGGSIDNAVIILGEIENIAGEYVFNEVIHGTYSLEVLAEGYETYYLDEIQVEQDLDMEIILIAVTYNLTFQVKDQEGNSIENAIITFDGTTNQQGNYAFEGIRPGNYGYSVSKEGYFTHEDEVDIEEEAQIIEVVLLRDNTGVFGETETQLKIYPNPAANRIFIQSGHKVSMIRLIDISGREILQMNPQQKNFNLSLDEIRNGIYFLQIQTQGGITTEKIQITK